MFLFVCHIFLNTHTYFILKEILHFFYFILFYHFVLFYFKRRIANKNSNWRYLPLSIKEDGACSLQLKDYLMADSRSLLSLIELRNQ